jgi:hypothetical protein
MTLPPGAQPGFVVLDYPNMVNYSLVRVVAHDLLYRRAWVVGTGGKLKPSHPRLLSVLAPPGQGLEAGWETGCPSRSRTGMLY